MSLPLITVLLHLLLAAHSSVLPVLDLPPQITSVLIDIGAFDRPIAPSGPTQVVIAVEPLPVKCADILRKRLDNTILLCAAVAVERGVALLHTYGSTPVDERE